MQVWRALDEVDLGTVDLGTVDLGTVDGGHDRRTVVTVGNFDGVHRGHQHVIDLVVARAREAGSSAVVVSFDPHPMAVIHPGGAPLALTTLDRRLALLAERGVDATLVLPFTSALAHLSPEQFVREVLVDTLHVSEVHVGVNFRFGHRAAGTVETLTELGSTYDFTTHPVELARDAAVWSSTYVRQCLAEGDVVAAADALGRPPRVDGVVIEGDKRGRQLGYPTANLAADPAIAVPADGVYAGWLVRAAGDRLPAAISVGTNPTFDGTSRRVEAYVLDRDDLELYGELVGVEFVQRLREMVNFDGIDPLLVQMRKDVDQARDLMVGG